jgi:SAM-dependent methyltransferase
MAFKYKDVVPWGRNFDEYVRMFDLSENDLQSRILGCGDGPASFNFECNQRGGNVISVDPLYSMSKEEIKKRIDETYNEVISQTEKNKDKFKWDTIGSVAELGRVRMNAMQLFLKSYDQGINSRKYIPASLPNLPFEGYDFDISLSSHFLFLYTDNLSYDFHVDAITEMLRVSKETRIFPLLDVNAKKSSYVQQIMSDFKEMEIVIRQVDYEFQIGGNELLVIRNR